MTDNPKEKVGKMKINKIEIQRAADWNNGQPGGAEGFVIWLDDKKDEPVLTRTIDGVAEYIKQVLQP